MLGNGTGGFASPQNYAAGAAPAPVELADFNGDGRIDLMTANSGDGTVSVLLNGGSGTFRPPLSFAAGSQPVAAAVGDFNGDGRAGRGGGERRRRQRRACCSTTAPGPTPTPRRSTSPTSRSPRATPGP